MRPSLQRRAESIARALVTVLLRTSGTAHRATPTVSGEALQATEGEDWVWPVAAGSCGAEGGCVSGQLFVSASTESTLALGSPFGVSLRISKRYLDPQSRPSTVAEVWFVETTPGAAAATPTTRKANRKTSFSIFGLRRPPTVTA
jgi:hypothetical protein